MNIQQQLEKLYSLHTFGVKLGLDNIKNFLIHLEQPQLKLKAFHIAGSNGKGSTSSFIASILHEMGCKVGLYTSPHFVRFNERIKINGDEIEDEYVAEFINKYEKYIDENKLTFFEVTTAMAFDYFRNRKVDYAVIETGLGGRLDATNLLQPCASVITSISLEHTHILGDTIEKIAAEKAGIIKGRSKVFISKLPEEAVKVIEKKCAETGSELFKLEDYINERAGKLELYTEEIELDDWTMPLRGNYQKYNAALAGLTVSKSLDMNDFNLLSAGIQNVVLNTGIQGRYEFFNNDPDIILDSAHNTEGIFHFLSEFNKSKLKYNRKVLLFGALKDKAVEDMFLLLREHFDEFHICHVESERACSAEELIKTAENINLSVIPEPDPAKFVDQFRSNSSGNCLVVLGSMYLIGQIKQALKKK